MRNSLLTSCVQPIEGVDSTLDRNSYQGVKPLEGVCSFVIRSNELFNQFNRFNTFVNYPLEGVRISAQNLVQSSSSWLNSLVVTFLARFQNFRPVWILFWLFTAILFESGSFPYFIGIFLIHINFWTYWCLLFVFGSSIFQTVEMDSTINDSFEQLLNQFVPVNQRWFSYDRARPSFHAEAFRPKRHTVISTCGGFQGPVRPDSGKLPLAEAAKVWSSRTCCTTSPQLGHPQVFRCHPDRKSLSGLVGILEIWSGITQTFQR